MSYIAHTDECPKEHHWHCNYCPRIETITPGPQGWIDFCRASYDHTREDHPEEWTEEDEDEYRTFGT